MHLRQMHYSIYSAKSILFNGLDLITLKVQKINYTGIINAALYLSDGLT